MIIHFYFQHVRMGNSNISASDGLMNIVRKLLLDNMTDVTWPESSQPKIFTEIDLLPVAGAYFNCRPAIIAPNHCGSLAQIIHLYPNLSYFVCTNTFKKDSKPLGYYL